jgi:hypothetical protein
MKKHIEEIIKNPNYLNTLSNELIDEINKYLEQFQKDLENKLEKLYSKQNSFTKISNERISFLLPNN